MDILKLAMKEDEELFKFLNAPVEELPINYRYIVYEISSGCKTLLNVIESALKWRALLGIDSFFLEEKDEITGFVAYMHGYDKVYDLKIFLFKANNENVISFDILVDFLDELLMKYEKVSWDTIKNNPTNEMFQKIIQKYNGQITEYLNTKTNNEIVKYTIINHKQNKIQKDEN
jgi:hypothetical protein